MYEINEYLLNCRLKADLSQLELSQALGYSSPQFISNVERKRCYPSLMHLNLWAKFVGADPVTCAQLLLAVHKKMIIDKTGIKF